MLINEQNRIVFVKKSSLALASSPPSSPHQNGNKVHSCYSCSYCSKQFSSPSHLSRHILIHTGEKPYLCSECGQQFSQVTSLDRHQRTKHDKDKRTDSSNSSLYQCKLCHEYFSLKHNLKMHEKKLHKIQTNYFCDLCSAYFTCNSSLQKHRNFRHRSTNTKQSHDNSTSDNWTVTTQINRINSPTASVSHTLTDEPMLSINNNDLFTNTPTNPCDMKTIHIDNTNEEQKQTAHYRAPNWNDINS